MRILFLLICPMFLYSQKNCDGRIVDKITGKGIPYATIGLILENKGVSANNEGAFSIKSAFPKTDSLRISSVGYQIKQLSVLEWTNGKVVELEPKPSLMEDILISANRKKRVYTINRFGHCSWNWYQIGLEAMYQLAQLFNAPREGLQLTEVQLCKDPSESLFRIRIYDVDSNYQYPSKDLVDTIIEVRSKESHVNISLEKYHIIIPGKCFFVAIEWLFIPLNEVKEKTYKNGTVTNSVFYKPAIRYVLNHNMEKGNSWRLGFNGNWSEISSSDKYYNFQITIKLR